MKQAKIKYFKDFGLAMALYVVTILGAQYILRNNELGPTVSIILALLPVLPTLLALRALLTYSRTWDELQKQQATESVLVAFLLVGFGSFAYGFLEGIGMVPNLETTMLLPVMIVVQGLAQFFVARKYQ